MKHTPTPWEIVSFDERQIQSATNALVCLVKGSFQNDNDEDKANAAFIVKAVNEHAALVAVADAARELDDFGYGKVGRKTFKQALANLAAIRAGSEVAK